MARIEWSDAAGVPAANALGRAPRPWREFRSPSHTPGKRNRRSAPAQSQAGGPSLVLDPAKWPKTFASPGLAIGEGRQTAPVAQTHPR